MRKKPEWLTTLVALLLAVQCFGSADLHCTVQAATLAVPAVR